MPIVGAGLPLPPWFAGMLVPVLGAGAVRLGRCAHLHIIEERAPASPVGASSPATGVPSSPQTGAKQSFAPEGCPVVESSDPAMLECLKGTYSGTRAGSGEACTIVFNGTKTDSQVTFGNEKWDVPVAYFKPTQTRYVRYPDGTSGDTLNADAFFYANTDEVTAGRPYRSEIVRFKLGVGNTFGGSVQKVSIQHDLTPQTTVTAECIVSARS